MWTADQLLDKVRKYAEKCITIPNSEYDLGSIQDQIWEEFGFYPVNSDRFVTLEYVEGGKYLVEILEIVAIASEKTTWAYQKTLHDQGFIITRWLCGIRSNLDTILEKRTELKNVNPPVVYVDHPLDGKSMKVTSRWGITEHPDSEDVIGIFSQKKENGEWGEKTFFTHGISFGTWLKLKPMVFLILESANDPSYCSDDPWIELTAQVFAGGSREDCITVTISADEPCCIDLQYQEVNKEGFMETKETLDCSIDKDDWKKLNVTIENFGITHFEWPIKYRPFYSQKP